jgi:hypothetical protein
VVPFSTLSAYSSNDLNVFAQYLAAINTEAVSFAVVGGGG